MDHRHQKAYSLAWGIVSDQSNAMWWNCWPQCAALRGPFPVVVAMVVVLLRVRIRALAGLESIQSPLYVADLII